MPDKMESPDETVIKNGSGETPVPEWLEKLQNESWQAELLISGGALVGLFSSYDFIERTSNYFKYSTSIDSSSIDTLKITSGLVVFILIIGFISHLVLRGFWIGLIGLNSVFPGGINAAKLSFQGRFRNFFKEEKNNSLILRLDKVCGLIFALTFVTLFSFLGVTLFLQAVFIFDEMVPGPSEVDSVFVKILLFIVFLVVIVAGILTLIDFLTGGWLKKFKWLAPIYYPIHRVVSIITLSFLYRRLYYTVVSNIKGFYVILILSIPIALVLMLSVFNESHTELTSFQNRDAGFEPEFQTSFLSIRNEKVGENELEISILHLVRLEHKAFEEWKKHDDNPARSFNELGNKEQAAILRKLYRIHIDSRELMDSSDWLVSLQNDGGSFKSLKWIKLIKFIDIHALENGNHKLSVKINLESDDIDGFKINQKAGYQATLNFILHRPKQPDKIPGED